MDDRDGFKEFVKSNFRMLKVKDNENLRMGRRTYDWIIAQEHTSRLSHLTPETLSHLIEKLGLSKAPFDDGFTYIVKPEIEREIMVEFYQEKQEKEEEVEAAAPLRGQVALDDDELLDSYRISELAVEAITGDSMEDLDLKADAVVDFITNDVLEEALASGWVVMTVEDGLYTILACDEEGPETEVHPLHVERSLPGAEVPINKLELKERTSITGAYRDQVSQSSHDFEHIITRKED
jgi:hypothetical protein